MLVSKRKSSMSLEKVEKYIKEGRGQGEMETYRPWLSIQSFPSMGRVSRIKGSKTNRIHHFLSDLELMYFYILEWDENVIDIREHYPLLDLSVVLSKDDLELRKKTEKLLQLPNVMTTNFLITQKTQEDKVEYIARSVKYESALDRQGVKEKLQIQELYLRKKGVEFKVITEQQINTNLAKNIESFHEFLFDDDFTQLNKLHIKLLNEEFITHLKTTSETVLHIANSFESKHRLPSGSGILLFKYLIAKRKLSVNLNNPIDYNKSFLELQG
jgi:hypothetical protein